MTTGFPDDFNANTSMDLTQDGAEDTNMVLDLEGTSTELPKIIAMPPGIYDAIIENTEYKMSQSSGNPMIAWTFTVTDPEYPNRKLFYHTVLNSEQGQIRLKQLLIRCCPDVPLKDFKPSKFCDEGLAIGMPCRIKVRIKPYKGEKRNEVQEVLEPSVGGFMDEVI